MRERDSFVSFAMLPSALLVSPLLGDSVHCEIHLFGLIEGAAIFRSVSLPQRGWTKFAWRSRLISRSEAIGHTEAVPLALGPLRQDHHLLLFSSLAAWASLPLSCPASRAVCVAQRFVEFSADPQTVQKHRKLPGHGYHRSLLGVFGSPRGYLLSVASEV
jgi:hypothetical protein